MTRENKQETWRRAWLVSDVGDPIKGVAKEGD
jgi:hypothetical protein